MTDADSLLAQGESAIAAVDAYLLRSSQRRDFREGHDRKLSQAHLAQLIDLRQRIDNILDPPASMETLRQEFADLTARLEAII